MVVLADQTIPVQSTPIDTSFGAMLFPEWCTAVTPAVRQNGAWAAEETVIVQSAVRPGDFVLDVGAHVGYISLAAAAAAGSSGLVISVESSPDLFKMLEHNMQHMSASPFALLHQAAGTGPDKAWLKLPEASSVDSRCFFSEPRVGEGYLEVPCSSLDQEILGEIDRLDFVRLNVCGAEVDALVGIQGILARWRPMLMMNFCPRELLASGRNPHEALEAARDMGYIIRIPGMAELGDVDNELVYDIAASNASGRLNLLAIPRGVQS